MSGFTTQFKKLPPSIIRLLEFVTKQIKPEAILLFGSRARGDHRENSDFDIAIKKEKMDSANWSSLLVTLDEEPFTLHKVDLVHYQMMAQNYKDNIDREGLILYE